MTAWYEPALEAGLLPDWAIRLGIRTILEQRLREQQDGGPDAQQARKLAFIESLRRSPFRFRFESRVYAANYVKSIFPLRIKAA